MQHSRHRNLLRLRASTAVLGAALVAAACGDANDGGTGGGAAEDGAATFDDAGIAEAGASAVVEAGTPIEGATDAPPARSTLSVLFIGNSYTYVNDVPGLLSRIASTSPDGPFIVTEQVVEGGQTLR